MPRPASESASQETYMARWYETFLDVCKAAGHRDFGIVCHPDHKSAMMDMMERVAEDPLWPSHMELPPLVFYTKAPRDQFMFIDKTTMKALTIREGLNSHRGLGRYAHILTPDATLRKDG